jgi:hypothetical protein
MPLWRWSWLYQRTKPAAQALAASRSAKVCAGAISLHAARVAIQKDWHGAYRKYVAADPSIVPRGVEAEEEEVVE